ncbi:MAG: hypothetical protein AB1568_10595 [Thermodesulfobacteriota bacterium]
MRVSALLLVSLALVAVGDARAQCLRGNCQSGIGMADVEESVRYLGVWRQGEATGPGFLIYNPDEDENLQAVYEGTVVAGRKEGQGVIYFPDGTTYQGEFINDTYGGYGIFSYSEGGRYEGMFRDGEYDGYGTYVFPDGRKKQGYWEMGRFVREEVFEK